MGIKTCFYCGEEINIGEGRVVPLDKPRVNLWAHRENCATAMDAVFLEENKERVYQYASEYEAPKKGKR